MTLDALVGPAWFSTLNLEPGCYQVDVRPEAAKPAFMILNSLREFETVAFGLPSTPVTLHKVLHKLLRDIVPGS